MPRHPSGRRKYQLQALHPIHTEICRRLTVGDKAKDIAADLNCTTAMISYTKNSILGQMRMAELCSERDEETVDVLKEIQKHAEKAVNILGSVLDNEDDNAPLLLRVRVSQDILDRAGYGAVKHIEGRFGHLHAYLSPEQIEELKQRGVEMGIVAVQSGA